MGEITREELAAMTDQELLAYEREHHGDPCMTLAKAKGMQRVALQFWHVGTLRKPSTRRRRWSVGSRSSARAGMSAGITSRCRVSIRCGTAV